MGEVIAADRFTMGKRQMRGPCDHLFDQIGVPCCGQKPPAKDGAVHHRLDHTRAAQFLEHHGDVEARTAEAALFFGEQGTQNAEFGQLRPDVRAEARVAVQDAVAFLGRIAVAQETPQRVLQHLAFFGQIEVHFRPPAIRVWAMMLRCTSFEPPKIDSLR